MCWGRGGALGVLAHRQWLSQVHLLQMYLRELLRLMHPRFYQHLSALGEDGLQMLFCHRWILLCFKREFPDAEALRMWEACWAHYQVGVHAAHRQCALLSPHLSTLRGSLKALHSKVSEISYTAGIPSPAALS